MKLCQIKELFVKIFDMPANAANARSIMRKHNISIVRTDFRCTKTWEMLMNCFDVFKELVNLANEFIKRVNNPTVVTENPDNYYDGWIPCSVLDSDDDLWWEET